MCNAYIHHWLPPFYTAISDLTLAGGHKVSTVEQTCLLLRFGRKVYALKALFTVLRLSCQILRFLAAVSIWIIYDWFVW